MSIWDKKHGQVNVAFRGGWGFDAVTELLESMEPAQPVIPAIFARDLARKLGVIGLDRGLDSNDIQDMTSYRRAAEAINGLPISDEDRAALLATIKASAVSTRP